MKLLKKISRSQSKCPAKEDITAYLCNEIVPDKTKPLQEHIDLCPACKKLADEIHESIKVLNTLKKMPPVPDLLPAILARITTASSCSDTTEKTASRILLLRNIIFYAAASVVAVLILIYGTTHSHKKEKHVVNAIQNANIPDLTQYKHAGLLWLVKAQEQDGSWEPARWGGKREYTIGLTGISLLALLENEEDFPEKNPCIERACTFLLKQQHKDGRFGHAFDGTMYNHGIATTALLEMYRKEKKRELEIPLKSALAFIRQNQLATGGWTYINSSTETANTSISTWPLLALLISYDIGWGDPEHSIKRAIQWLVGLIDEQGQFGYEQRGVSPYGTEALTAMGAYCLLRAEKAGININHSIMDKVRHKLYAIEKSDKNIDYYKTYFKICVLKEASVNVNNSLVTLKEQLASRMQQSGSEKGSWEPADQWSSTGGRIYSTALAIMSL